MPVYAWKGVNASGRNARGFIDADSARGARTKLRRDGVFPTELSESQSAAEPTSQTGFSLPFSLPTFRRISPLDLSLATRPARHAARRWCSLGVGPLRADRASRVAALQGHLGHDPRPGKPRVLVRRLTGRRRRLPRPLHRAGPRRRSGGALETVLTRLAEYLEGQVRMRNRVLSIMVYPAVMLASHAL